MNNLIIKLFKVLKKLLPVPNFVGRVLRWFFFQNYVQNSHKQPRWPSIICHTQTSCKIVIYGKFTLESSCGKLFEPIGLYQNCVQQFSSWPGPVKYLCQMSHTDSWEPHNT